MKHATMPIASSRRGHMQMKWTIGLFLAVQYAG